MKGEQLDQTSKCRDNFLQLDLFGKKSNEKVEPCKDGNVILGYASDTALMLDVDEQVEEFVIRFAIRYARFHKLGSVMVLRSSLSSKTDLLGNKLANFFIIFGKPLCWEEISWHISETRRLGVINRGFATLRNYGHIILRENSKNRKIAPPEVIKFYNNGDMTVIADFISDKNISQGIGEFWLQSSCRLKKE
jgi:hypothetical protein